MVESNQHGFCGSAMVSQENNEDQLFWPFHCWSCSRSFSSFSFLEGHFRDGHQENYCGGCEVILGSPGDQKRHLDHYHYPCVKCKLYFNNEENIREHWENSQSHKEDYCFICNRIFDSRANWWYHMESFHNFCQLCGQGFWTVQYLREHIAEQHSRPHPKREAMPDKGNPNFDHYATLGLNPRSSHNEVLRKARLQRIACHPDKVLQQKGLSAEDVEKIQLRAKRVGQAADVLSDPLSRLTYDIERSSRN